MASEKHEHTQCRAKYRIVMEHLCCTGSTAGEQTEKSESLDGEGGNMRGTQTGRVGNFKPDGLTSNMFAFLMQSKLSSGFF